MGARWEMGHQETLLRGCNFEGSSTVPERQEAGSKRIIEEKQAKTCFVEQSVYRNFFHLLGPSRKSVIKGVVAARNISAWPKYGRTISRNRETSER